MSEITTMQVQGEQAILIDTGGGSTHMTTESALAAWSELLGIEDPVEVVELMLEAAEHPIAYEDTPGNRNEWSDLYEAYELRMQAEKRAALGRAAVPAVEYAVSALPQGPLIEATQEQLQERRKAMKARMVGDATRSRRKKPRKVEERGIDREKLASVVDGFEVGRCRKRFRKEFEDL